MKNNQIKENEKKDDQSEKKNIYHSEEINKSTKKC